MTNNLALTINLDSPNAAAMLRALAGVLEFETTFDSPTTPKPSDTPNPVAAAPLTPNPVAGALTAPVTPAKRGRGRPRKTQEAPPASAPAVGEAPLAETLDDPLASLSDPEPAPAAVRITKPMLRDAAKAALDAAGREATRKAIEGVCGDIAQLADAPEAKWPALMAAFKELTALTA